MSGWSDSQGCSSPCEFMLGKLAFPLKLDSTFPVNFPERTHPRVAPAFFLARDEMADDPVRSAGEIKNDARDDRLSGPMSLRHRERNHVRKQMAADARDKCWETRDAYVECARGVHFPCPCAGIRDDFNCVSSSPQAGRSACRSCAAASSRSSTHA